MGLRLLSPLGPGQSDRETSMIKKRTPEPRTGWYGAEFRHRDGIQDGREDGWGKHADRKTGPSPCLLKPCGRQAKGYRPQGGGPRFPIYSLGTFRVH